MRSSDAGPLTSQIGVSPDRWRTRGSLAIMAGALLTLPLPGARTVQVAGRVAVVQGANLLTFNWPDGVLKRSLAASSPASVDGDALAIYQLHGTDVSVAYGGSAPVPFFASQVPVSDLLLLPDELLLIRSSAPSLRLDRFSAEVLGEWNGVSIDDLDGWSRPPFGDCLIGYRDEGNGATVRILDRDGASRAEPLFLPWARMPAKVGVWPCRGGRLAWLPDGTLRRLRDGGLILDSSQPIQAAAAITSDLHLVGIGRDVQMVDLHGNRATLVRLLSDVAQIFYDDGVLVAIDSAGRGTLRVLADNPPGFPGVYLPPSAGNTQQLNGFQRLSDGTVVCGNDDRAVGYAWDADAADFRSGFALPSAGRLHVFERLARIGQLPRSGMGVPSFADFVERPAWVAAVPPAGSYNRHVLDAVTANSWSVRHQYDLSSPQQVRYDALTGGHLPNLLPAYGTVDATAWSDPGDTLFTLKVPYEIDGYRWNGTGGEAIGSSVQRPVTGPGSAMIRVSPDGTMLATDSGVWLSGPIRHVAWFEQPVTDVAWLAGRVHTLRQQVDGHSIVERRGGPFHEVLAAVQLAGTPRALRSGDSDLLVVTEVEGLPVVHLLDADLRPSTSRRVAVPLTGVRIGRVASDLVELWWTPPPAGLADGVEAEFRLQSAFGNGAWLASPCVAASTGTIVVSDLMPKRKYEFRLRCGTGADAWTSEIIVRTTLSSGDGLDGLPYDLRVVAPSVRGRIALSWADRYNDETGFVIARSDLTSGSTNSFTVGPDATGFEDLQVSAEHDYEYRVIAQRAGGAGASSAPVITRIATEGVVQRPRLLAVSLGSVLIDWPQLAGTQPDWIWVERRSNGEASWTILGVLPPDRTWFRDERAPFAGTSSYRVVRGSATVQTETEPLEVAHARMGDPGFDPPQRVGDIVYLLAPRSGVVRRFDPTSGEWLGDLEFGLREPPVHFHVSPLGVFVGSKRMILRMSLEGGAPEVIWNDNTAADIGCMWSGGSHLHVSTRRYSNYVIASLESRGDGTFEDPVFLAIGAKVDSVAIGPDSSLVYGMTRGLDRAVMLIEEVTPGQLIRREFRSASGSSPGARTRVLTGYGYLVSDDGYRYDLDSVAELGKPIGGWQNLEELPSGHSLAIADGFLLAYDLGLQQRSRTTLAENELATSCSGKDAWVFSFHPGSPDTWSARAIPLKSLGLPYFDPDNPDPYFGEPHASFAAADAQLWSLYPSGNLVARNPDDPAISHDVLLGGIPVDWRFDPVTGVLAILLQPAPGQRTVEIHRIGAADGAIEEFPVFASAHSLAWVGADLRVHGTDQSALYTSSGEMLETALGIGNYMSQATIGDADIKLIVGPTATTLTIEIDGQAHTSVFDSEFQRRSTLIEPSPAGDRVLVHPGGLYALSPSLEQIHLNAIEPLAAAWQGSRLLVIDSLGSRRWLIAYDGVSGRELARIPLIESAFDVVGAADGNVLVFYLNSARKVVFDRLDADFSRLPVGNAGPVFADFPFDRAQWIEGLPAELPALVSGAGPFTYRWYRDGALLADQTGAILRLDVVTPADEGEYRIRAVSPSGLWLTVQPAIIRVNPADRLVARRGHYLTASGIHIREHDVDGNLVGGFERLSGSYLPTRSCVGEDGRFHLLTVNSSGDAYRLETYDPDSARWEILSVPSPGNLYNGTVRMATTGTCVRLGRLSVDLMSGTVRRMEHDVIRNVGTSFVTERGLEDALGSLLGPAPAAPVTNWLSNGWAIAPVFGHLLFIDGESGDARIRSNIMGFGYQADDFTSDVVVGDGFITRITNINRIRLDLATFDYTITSHNYLANSVCVIPRPAYMPTAVAAAYFDCLCRTYDAQMPAHLFVQLRNEYLTEWILPSGDENGNGVSNWNEAFLPPGPPGANWRTPVRTGSQLYYRLPLPIDPASGVPLTRIEFSGDLQSWSEQLPAGAASHVSPDDASIWEVKLDPGSTIGCGCGFFRLVPPTPPSH